MCNEKLLRGCSSSASGSWGAYITIDVGRHFCSIPVMARLASVVIPGMPHHVTQRGNRRQTGDDDFQKRLEKNLRPGTPPELRQPPIAEGI